MIHVSKHAVQRYQERVAPVSREEALAAIREHGAAIECAASIAGQAEVMVKVDKGLRLVVRDYTIVTVYGAECRFNRKRK